MFRGLQVGLGLRERVLAVTFAIGFHGLALALASWLVAHAPRPAVTTSPPLTKVHYITARAQKPSRTGPPGAATAPRARGHRIGSKVTPNMPEMIIDVAPRGTVASAVASRPPEAIGDSARGGGPSPAPQWNQLVLAGPSVASPHPSPSCVPHAPAMPEDARLAGISGSVDAVYDVGADGVARAARLDGHPLLSRAVRQWLERCRFEPALENGEPAPGRMRQTFRFVLR
jgi:outer membrane biosynthesis protein TonB